MFKTVVAPSSDLDAAKKIYSAVLGEPHTDEPYYVGWSVGEQEFGLNPQGHEQGLVGPTPYLAVDDVAAAVAALVEAGATTKQEPTEVGGGTTIALVADTDGGLLGLIQQS